MENSLKYLHNSHYHPTLKAWHSRDSIITQDCLMYPLFLVDNDDNAMEEIGSMPGIHRYGINAAVAHLQELVASKGLKSVLLFGVLTKLEKDLKGSHADSQQTPVIRAVKKFKDVFPNLIIACDVCLCEYTENGQCGLFKNGVLDNKSSIDRIAEVALEYARAGAHIVAPSDMMDGRVGAIKQKLFNTGYGSTVSILSYSSKFQSSFYGPFRDAAKSSFKDDGRGRYYQLPPGSSALARRANERDVAEGADMLMVKPGLPYLDIVKETKQQFPHYPLFIYQVSGEYAMLVHGSKAGAFDLKKAVMETLTCMRRAGADVIITYFTPQALDWIKQE